MLGRKKQQQNTGRRRSIQENQKQSSTFSYYANRGNRPEDVPRRREGQSAPRKAKLSWLHQLPSYLALAAIVISLLFSLGLSTNPRIIQLQDTLAPNQHLRDSSVYQAEGRKILNSSFSSRSKLTIDTQAVSMKLKQHFPEISNAYISVPLVGRRPVISLQLAQPQLLLMSSDHRQYVLDDSGRVMLPADQAQKLGTGDLPAVTDQSGLQVAVGKVVLPKESVSFIKEVVAQLQAKHISLESLVLPTSANELQVHIKGVAYYVKFNMAEDPRQQAGTYLALKDNLEQSHITPAEYIDVRVPERAYYK
ncbi:MAG: hypothetical protein JWS12_639 [Candidatus Saccharibacteria bacterium]|nr:hypothetical protein [Candidatus Saccharibacteria bacterium]